MSQIRSSDRAAEATGVSARILEIDFIRGFMLISMALDHGTSLCRAMGRHAASPITIAQVLPSTTAEIFFLMSGYLFGHTRLAKMTAVDRTFLGDTLKRTWQLYAYNAVTLLLVMAFMSLASPTLLGAGRFDLFATDPFTAARNFVLMRSAPFGFDVLQIYIIFFLATPLFAWLLLKSPSAALAWLVTCWVAVGIWSRTIGLEHDETIAINIWAWQITFFGGMWLGVGRRYAGIARVIVTDPRIFRGACLLLAVIAIGWIGQKYPHRMGLDESPWILPGVDRATLGPLKIVSSLCVVVAMIWLADRFRIVETQIGRALAMLGRHSLACFCASNFGLYWVALAWQASGSHAVFWLAEGLFVAFIFGWVALVSTVMPAGSPKRKATPQPSAGAVDKDVATPDWTLTGHTHPVGGVR
ncbi:hypothetical protein ASG52_08490 [Methylobacterium sp. Leaf456]|uniref:OpgC domain-containing protein n=1 Tax=Methylobacterium sp. Leaf456 TaxID=1736382 RepID=UPI0006F6BF17|nr:OpgC domain-containing protein [Methylobacterium sp. Leaf456]KQT50093.1 hypothetical protein ASG52_08490 [Methylobacterium sp. Leaf456]